MCKVTIDVWICPVCRNVHDSFDRPHSWDCCNVGPTYDRSCPNFEPTFIRRYDYLCDPCKAANEALEEERKQQQQQQEKHEPLATLSKSSGVTIEQAGLQKSAKTPPSLELQPFNKISVISTTTTTKCLVWIGQRECWRCGQFIKTISCSQSQIACDVCPNYDIKCPDFTIDYNIYKEKTCAGCKRDLEPADAADEKMAGNGEKTKEHGSA